MTNEEKNKAIMEVIGDVMNGTILEHIHNTTSK